MGRRASVPGKLDEGQITWIRHLQNSRHPVQVRFMGRRKANRMVRRANNRGDFERNERLSIILQEARKHAVIVVRQFRETVLLRRETVPDPGEVQHHL